MTQVSRLIKCERGATAAEYAVIASLISIAAIGGIGAIGARVVQLFASVTF